MFFPIDDEDDDFFFDDFKSAKSESLKEGLDFYLENGYRVFTEHYLSKRGYCCKNGCRHCPYGFDKRKARE